MAGLTINRGTAIRVSVVLVVLILAVTAGLWFSDNSTSARHSQAVSRKSLDEAIDLSAEYLTWQCDRNGQFVYLVNLDPAVTAKPRYNIVRHAGAMYALAMYHREHPSDAARDTLLRAARFLKEIALAPLPGHDDLLAVWSYAEITPKPQPLDAKLGGAGLGLAALVSVEQIEPGFTSMEDLRGLGRFLIYMQKPDGSFYCKCLPKWEGRTDKWVSLYYPGEAALGLLMLYEKDPSPVWLQAAAEAIAYLARSRAGRPDVEADHWALLATARLLPVYDRCRRPLPREAIVQHATQICTSILAKKPRHPAGSVEYGCMTDDGRTCPTAIRLEGMLATLTFLPEENRLLRQQITAAAAEGTRFLLRSQVRSGQYAGGIPRATTRLSADDPRSEKSPSQRRGEIRIDYVQHALSAMIQYRQTFYRR